MNHKIRRRLLLLERFEARVFASFWAKITRTADLHVCASKKAVIPVKSV